MRTCSSVMLILLVIAGCRTEAESSSASISPELASWEKAITERDIYGLRIGASSDQIATHDTIMALEVKELDIDSVYRRVRQVDHLVTGIELIYPTDSTYALWHTLQHHLDELYGESRPTEGYCTWNTSSDSGQLVEVELVDAKRLFSAEEIRVSWNVNPGKKYED